MLVTRQLRARHFNRAIFGEPAWDSLLILHISDAVEGRQTIGHNTVRHRKGDPQYCISAREIRSVSDGWIITGKG